MTTRLAKKILMCHTLILLITFVCFKVKCKIFHVGYTPREIKSIQAVKNMSTDILYLNYV